jgi:hypothetical protein
VYQAAGACGQFLSECGQTSGEGRQLACDGAVEWIDPQVDERFCVAELGCQARVVERAVVKHAQDLAQSRCGARAARR